MIISMTGYGEGESSNDAATVTVEVRTVNHRFMDLAVKVPRVLNARERDIKEAVKSRIARGRVYVTITVDTDLRGRAVSLNEAAMENYLRQMKEFAAKHGLPDNVDVNALVQLPDAVLANEENTDTETLWPLAEKALSTALDQCHEMRVVEGRALAADLAQRIQAMSDTVTKVEALAPDVSRKHAEAFRKRVLQLMDDVQVDEDRLTAEIALMADRLDFTEELTRLRSHEAQFRQTLDDGGEVSKKLTYLLQEMHREASTIGAKASDSEVIKHVVALKEETEKLREQVQNVE